MTCIPSESVADNHSIPKIASAMNAHTEVVKLLDQLRAKANAFLSGKMLEEFNSATDSIEVMTRAYMEPKASVDWSEYGITPTERRFLDVLNRNFGRTVTYSALADAVYFDREMEDGKIMNVHVSKIRAKFLRDESCDYMIETDWGVGYKLVRKAEWMPARDRTVRRTGGVYAALEALRA